VFPSVTAIRVRYVHNFPQNVHILLKSTIDTAVAGSHWNT